MFAQFQCLLIKIVLYNRISNIMNKRRPYGISYEGLICKRLTSKEKKKAAEKQVSEHELLKNQGPASCIIIGHHPKENKLTHQAAQSGQQTKNQLIQSITHSSNKQPLPEMDDHQDAPIKDQEHIIKQLEYVEKFLILEQNNNSLSGKKPTKLKRENVELAMPQIQCECHCGRKFHSQNNLILHLKMKHKKDYINYFQSLMGQKLNQDKKFKGMFDWENRINKAFNLLRLDDQQGYRLCQTQTIDLNINFQSDAALHKFYLSCKTPKSKLATILFIKEMNSFLKAECNQQLHKIWLLEFSSMGLLSNFFYEWQTNIKLTSISMNDQSKETINELNNKQTQRFYLLMFQIFNNWCYFNEHCSSLLKLNTRKYKIIEQI